MNGTIITVSNQKGGTGKSTTCANLGIGLAMEGKRVLLADMDPQASLTISLGYQYPDKLPVTVTDLSIWSASFTSVIKSPHRSSVVR